MSVRKISLDSSEDRVETGIVQFGDDWPGIFIRGDNAFGFARALEEADRRWIWGKTRVFDTLIELFDSCDVRKIREEDESE